MALSNSPDKEALARELGAHEFIDGSKVDQAEALQKLGGSKVIICTAPSGKIIETLLGGLAVDGVIVILAVADKIEVPILPMIMKRLRIQVSSPLLHNHLLINHHRVGHLELHKIQRIVSNLVKL